MSDTPPTVRHLAHPVRLAHDGSLAALAQDTDAEVRQSIRMLLLTRPGDRLAASEYGSPDPTHRRADDTLIDADEITELLSRFDPRVADVDVAVTPTQVRVDPGGYDVTIAYTPAEDEDEEGL